MTLGRTRRIELLRRWSRLMDSAYCVPGTAIRFGWDPIAGLIPASVTRPPRRSRWPFSTTRIVSECRASSSPG